MTYVIRFDFPESDAPQYAGKHKGALGWAPTIATAILFEDPDVAKRTLDNGYGATALYGRIVQVKAGAPVA